MDMEETITYRNKPYCQLYYWGVDIQEGTAPISRGIIRDWIPRSGLIVDFLYPGQNEVHIPFRKLIGVSCRHRWKYATGDAVETIVQRSSDQPWRWYPSKVLATDSCGDCVKCTSYALVEIDYGGEKVREVMEPDRVRLPSGPPFKECSICRDPIQVRTGIRALGFQLHRHTVSLPDSAGSALLAVTKKDGFLRLWEREAKMTGAKFENGRLVYVSGSRTLISEGEMKRCLRRICGLYQARLTVGPLDSESGKLCALLPELIGEVLSFLDVNDQTKCRKVCRAFNWYCSFPKSRLVHIDLMKYYSENHQKLAVTLLKTVNSRTKTLVISGINLKTNRGLVQAAHMLKGMGNTIPTIILFQQNPVDGMENPNLGQWDCSALAKISRELLWQQTVRGFRSRVFRFQEGNGGLEKQWTEVPSRI